MESGVSRGVLHRAKFNMSRREHATVKVEGETYMVENNNRAVHGDSVCVQVLPKSQWKVPSKKLALGCEPVPTAKLVGILQRNWRE
jgi:exoribonuclease R